MLLTSGHIIASEVDTSSSEVETSSTQAAPKGSGHLRCASHDRRAIMNRLSPRIQETTVSALWKSCSHFR